MPGHVHFSRFLSKTPINFQPISRRNSDEAEKSCQKDTTQSAASSASRSRFREPLASGKGLPSRDASRLVRSGSALKWTWEDLGLLLAAKGKVERSDVQIWTEPQKCSQPPRGIECARSPRRSETLCAGRLKSSISRGKSNFRGV